MRSRCRRLPLVPSRCAIDAHGLTDKLEQEVDNQIERPTRHHRDNSQTHQHRNWQAYSIASMSDICNSMNGMTYPIATHNIIDVLTVSSSVGSDTCAEAEFVIRDEGGPFVVLETFAKGITIDETTN